MNKSGLTNDAANARAALAAARMLRAEYLVALAEGDISPEEMIQAACTERGKPLRKVSLRQMLISQPRVGEQRANDLLSAVADTLDLRDDISTKTIGWLIDPRSCGRRLLAWIDATHPRVEPWPGFPFSPQREEVADVA